VRALRGALFALKQGPDAFWRYSLLVFQTYWANGGDISDKAVVAAIGRQAGLDVQQFNAWVETADAKSQIRVNTADCIARGGFGSPTFVVNREHMYFGNDRLALLERRIAIILGDPVATVLHFVPPTSMKKSRL
jgi:2-hydroxychromene-2-carboxylate isomerase